MLLPAALPCSLEPALSLRAAGDYVEDENIPSGPETKLGALVSSERRVRHQFHPERFLASENCTGTTRRT